MLTPYDVVAAFRGTPFFRPLCSALHSFLLKRRIWLAYIIASFPTLAVIRLSSHELYLLQAVVFLVLCKLVEPQPVQLLRFAFYHFRGGYVIFVLLFRSLGVLAAPRLSSIPAYCLRIEARDPEALAS